MTNLEFQAEQSKLGLTNAEAAKLCRVSIRTVEKWRQGTRAVPGPVIALLYLCFFYKGAVKYPEPMPEDENR
jgi:DNA-binding transcriptional regulator YiaG